MRARLIGFCMALSACNGEGAALQDGSSSSCGGRETAALALVPRLAGSLPDSMIPSAVLLLEDGSLLVADGVSSGISLLIPGRSEARWIPAPEPLPTLARDGKGVVAAGLNAVYRIDTDSARVRRIAGVPVRTGQIVSVAVDDRTIWVATGGGGEARGGIYSATRQNTTTWQHRSLAAPVRVEIVGPNLIAAASTRAPFDIVLLDSALHTIGAAMPTSPSGASRREQSAFTQALIALDCGRLLHVVSDLRSDRRDLIIYQTMPEVRQVRTRTIRRPLGFVHSWGERSLVAVSEGGGRREVVRFEWSWEPELEER